MGDSTDSDGIRWCEDSSNGSWTSSDSWQQKNIFLSVAQGMWRKQRKRRNFIVALPPGCLLVYAFSVTCKELKRSWTFLLPSSTSLRLTMEVVSLSSLSLVPWDLDAVCAYILGLVYSTREIPNLSLKTASDSASASEAALYLFQLFRSYPWPRFSTSASEALLGLSLKPSPQITGFGPIASVSVNVVSFLSSRLYL